MREIRCEGIVISKTEYGEGDLYVTIFTENEGKISFNVKGIRKSKTREQSAVDILTCSNFIFIKKNENYSIRKFETVNSYSVIKSDIDSISMGLYTISVVNKLSHDGSISSKNYELLKKTLNYFEKKNKKEENLLCVLYFLYKWSEYEGIFADEIDEWIKIDSEAKNNIILNELLNKKIKQILEKNYLEYDIIKTIILYEKYINYHCEGTLNIKNFLLG